MSHQVFCGNCLNIFKQMTQTVDLTFLDPPFNQQKDYALHNDNMPKKEYCDMMKVVCQYIYDISNDGGSLYFMQREKNTEFVLRILRETGWEFQNLIIWKKKTSAVPVKGKYGKQYQIIAYAVKGEKANIFNRLRINPPLPLNYKMQRENGVFVTDVWDDIRELTAGYFAGNEAIRINDGSRFHKQQSPIALLLRMILTSSAIGDIILDPFAGTGTMSVVAQQLQRNSISIDIDINNVECIKSRLNDISNADSIEKYYKEYICTENLSEIWGNEIELERKQNLTQGLALFNEM
ncbi:MAG: site-specific DNA-methyltransferase [Elusimicrobiota bacterium]|jgi:DNA modification methylase|nr:site-specific DNA-methyltransferase [Elusimicrobiota bacterium]